CQQHGNRPQFTF
nr:immunoglobulin light chain junction region [Macaca mulatta]